MLVYSYKSHNTQCPDSNELTRRATMEYVDHLDKMDHLERGEHRDQVALLESQGRLEIL